MRVFLGFPSDARPLVLLYLLVLVGGGVALGEFASLVGGWGVGAYALVLGALTTAMVRHTDQSWRRRVRSFDRAVHSIAGRAGDRADALLKATSERLGEPMPGVTRLADALAVSRKESAAGRELAEACFQLGPHYMLLVSFEGEVLNANPAFLARTGLTPEALRDSAHGLPDEVLPLGPLLKLGAQARRDRIAHTGIEYGLRSADGSERPVEVALRTVRTPRGEALLLQLTDRTRLRRMTAQIGQFSDALDLMVNRRVAELTAGLAGLDVLLDAAGVVVAT
ncbi:MAG: PAS domain S-box protein, partial [Rhodothermales bacterium]|nr:PAS domain S-box protein [Rhodothermales bacterium]